MREAKKVPKKTPTKGGKKGKKAASPTRSLDSTKMDGGEGAEEVVETDVSESKGCEESELENIVVVRGREVGNFRGFFLDHEPCPSPLFNKSNSLPKQPLASIYGLTTITALVDFF